ncbi:MAG: hypothetical protein VX265_02780 [Myxococcota bacterium]|nr:hypothetical protein [Myxococcota bacterium]
MSCTPRHAARVGVLLIGLAAGRHAAAQEPVPEAPAAVGDVAPPPLRTRRAVVGWLGLTGLVSGAAWFMVAGDSLGAGDPAGVLLAGGGIALAGAAVGRLIDGPWEMDAADPRSAGTPALEVGVTPGGTTTIGEQVPWGLDVGVAPRVQGPGLQFIGAARAAGQLGEQVAVDPRSGAGDAVAFRSRRRSVRAEPELRWERTDLDLQLLPMFWSGVETVEHADGSTRGVRREAMVAAVGVRTHITARQRFLLAVGPRFDALSWTEQGAFTPRTWTRGPGYGAVHWQFDLPGLRALGAWDASSRLGFGYAHTNFDGAGFDTAASIGFFGPILATWDLRMQRPAARHAVQVGVDAAVGTGGGVVARLGWVPPRFQAGRSRGREETP